MTRASILVGVLASMAIGCRGPDANWTKKLPWVAKNEIQESQYQTPARMAAIWSPDTMTQPGKPPVRGFGGRFYFYDEKHRAVPVEGQLVVYAYDDSAKRTGQQRTPDRKYAFTPEQFTRHYSETDLGASYSVWIPWQTPNGLQESVSLLPVFTSTSGKIVVGEQVTNVLPGRLPQPATEGPGPVAPEQGVIPTAHFAPAGDTTGANASTGQRTMRTTTIPLSRSLDQRLRFSPAQPPIGQKASSAALQSPLSNNPWSARLTQEGSQDVAQPLPNGVLWQGPIPDSASYPAGPATDQPSAHSGLPSHPAPAAPGGQLDHVRAPQQPFPRSTLYRRPISRRHSTSIPAHEVSADGSQTGTSAR